MPAHSLKLTEIPRPFVCCVLLDDPTPDHVARTIKLAEYDGADAFDLELQGLDEAYRRPGALGRVFETATRPVFTVYRRYRLSGDRFDEQADLDAARMRAAAGPARRRLGGLRHGAGHLRPPAWPPPGHA